MKKMIALAALLLGFAVLVSAQAVSQEDPDLTYGQNLLKPGTPAPDFTLNDLSGRPVSLKDFRGKKVVLVFWATWCPDCRKEVPYIRALRARTKPSEVAIISISYDRSIEPLKKYVKENKMNWVQLFDDSGKKGSSVGEAYHTEWIPTNYLIDKDGSILMGTVSFDKINAALK